MPINQTLLARLMSLGLTQNEGILYLTVLEHGAPIRSGEIAKAAGIARTAVSHCLSDVMRRGLVSRFENQSGWDHYVAEDPQTAISQLIESRQAEKKAEIEREQRFAEEIMPELEGMFEAGREKDRERGMRVKYFEGMNGIITLYEDIAASGSPETMSYFYALYDPSIFERFSKYFNEDFVPKTAKKGMRFKTIFPRSNERVRDFHQVPNKPHFEARFAQNELINTPAFVSVYGDPIDRIALFSFSQENLGGILIQNEVLAKTQLALLKAIWEKAIPSNEI